LEASAVLIDEDDDDDASGDARDEECDDALDFSAFDY
jgi:hypothetical protein